MLNYFHTLLYSQTLIINNSYTLKLKYTAIILSLLLTVGCSTKETDPTEGMSAVEIYTHAKDFLDSGNFSSAIQYFESLESRYPFGVYATQSQLDVAYAYYLYGEPESATAAADRFIKLHPRHTAVDYAFYLKGLVNCAPNQSVMDMLYDRDLADYDKTVMQQSYEDFSILVSRFPESKYTRDAVKRMLFLRNQLAKSELNSAEFYLRRKAWVAAANRAKSVIEIYQGSPSVKRALQIQILAYDKLDLKGLANDTRRVLIHNFGEEAANITG